MITLLTALLYPIVIQYKRNAVLAVLLGIPALIALTLDVIANYTEVRLVYGPPLAGEYTVSRRVKRMANAGHPTALKVQRFLDYFEPDGKH